MIKDMNIHRHLEQKFQTFNDAQDDRKHRLQSPPFIRISFPGNCSQLSQG